MAIESISTEFAPFRALAGGALIGLSAVLYMGLNGRIAGISGLVSRLLPPWNRDSGDDRFGALAFMVGLLVPVSLLNLTGQALPEHSLHAATWLIAIAGLLVGLGAGVGSGCTSGHGVCGISRLSVRSILATVTFMFTGVITVFVVRHVLALGMPS